MEQTNNNKTKTKQQPAAETVIDGRLAGTGMFDRLRRISPATAALVGAVILALGLSAWPYLAPFFIASSEQRWQTDMEQQIGQIQNDMRAVTDQQTYLVGQLQVLQGKLAGLDQAVANTAASFARSTGELAAEVNRIDQDYTGLAEQISALARPRITPDKAAPVPAEADNPAPPPQPQPTDDNSVPPVPDTGWPKLSGWWQGLSGWFSGLVSVDRIQPEQEPE